MTAGAMSDLDVLASITEELERTCSSVTSSQWHLPTPCEEWSVAQLLDHITGGNRFTVAILKGSSGEDAMQLAVDSFGEADSHHLATVESGLVQLAAFHTTGALERRCDHVVGQLSGADVLVIRLHELIIHTWDLAVAASRPAEIPDDLVRWAVAEITSPGSLTTARFGLVSDLAHGSHGVSMAALLEAFGRSGNWNA